MLVLVLMLVVVVAVVVVVAFLKLNIRRLDIYLFIYLFIYLCRNECDRVAQSLNQAGLSAVAYHAGLADYDRIQNQEMWIKDRYKVLKESFVISTATRNALTNK